MSTPALPREHSKGGDVSLGESAGVRGQPAEMDLVCTLAYHGTIRCRGVVELEWR